MKKLLFAALALFSFASQAKAAPIYGTVQITTTTALTPTLQNGAIKIASGTIQNLNISTITVGTSFNANSHRLTSVSTPTATTDAATKGYVDSLGSGSTNYIQNGSTAQSATFNVSSGTVTNFTATASTSTNLNSTNFVATASTITTLNVTNAITTLSITTATITHLVGTTTNDNATAGTVGEYLSSYTQGVAATTSNMIAISTITLTAGDWDVSANCLASPNSGTVAFTAVTCYVGATAGNNTTGMNIGDNECEPSPSNVNNANSNISCAIPAVRVSVTGSTPYYLKIRANWATSTVNLYGRISARRVR